jgi:fumarate reductase flavoprotein subunit
MDTTITRRELVAGATVAGVAATGLGSVALADDAAYTPGTYSCQTIGIDLMTVTMTFSEHAIEDVQIDDNETRLVGHAIIGTLKDQIVNDQTADIDVVTGASVTSKAVRAAARNCVAQARGEAAPLPVDDLISPVPPVPAPDSWDYEADVAIVGASLAGLTCACKLAESGMSVVVLEKESLPGGSGRITDCIGNYGGNKFIEKGYFADEYHDQDVVDFFSERATWSVNTDLLKNIVVSLRETWDWFVDEGATMAAMGDWGIGAWWGCWQNTDTDGHSGNEPSGNTGYLIDWMYDIAESHGVRFLMSSPAKALVSDHGQVVGVYGEDPDGNDLYVRGTTAVALCGDSFQTNPKMLEAYGGLAAGVKSGLAKGTGYVIRMGQGVGADMAGIGSFAASTSMPVLPERRAMLPMRRNYDMINYLLANPWCRFDDRGQRVTFVETNVLEKLGVWEDMIDDNHRQCDQDLAHGDCFVVMDSDWLEKVQSNGSTQFRAFTGSYASQKIDGINCPKCSVDPRRGANIWFSGNGIESNFQDVIDEGGIVVADTLDELAEKLGVDAGVLNAAVKSWNDDCAAGQGDSLHNYTAQNMTTVENGPFYGARVTPGLYAAFAGLKVTPENQVVSTGGEPIPGLYAGFHTAGGIAGEHQHLCPVGDQIGSMLASGTNIAKSILGETWETI